MSGSGNAKRPDEGGPSMSPGRTTRCARGKISEYHRSMPNREEMKPDRRAKAEAWRKRRSILVRDAYFAIFVATLVVGGAKLFTRFFGGP